MGGVHILRYATLFPEGIAAVVLLDSPPPGFEEDRLRLLTPAEREERGRLLEQGLANLPATVRQEREGSNRTEEWDFSSFPSRLPLLVVVADSQDFGDLGSLEAHRRLWLERSREWLGLSERAEFMVAEGSGHMVHHDRQALVAEGIERFLDNSSGD